MTFKIEIFRFMNKVNRNNIIKPKPDILPWNIFKSDIIFCWSQYIKTFQ